VKVNICSFFFSIKILYIFYLIIVLVSGCIKLFEEFTCDKKNKFRKTYSVAENARSNYMTELKHKGERCSFLIISSDILRILTERMALVTRYRISNFHGRFSRSRTCFGGSGFSNCGQPDFHVSYVSCLPAYFRSPFLGLNYYGCRTCFSFYISLLSLDNYSHLCRTPSSVYL